MAQLSPADGEFVQPPVTPGHEFSGTVVALGEGAGDRHGVEIGDLVVSEQIVPCHDCRLERLKHSNSVSIINL